MAKIGRSEFLKELFQRERNKKWNVKTKNSGYTTFMKVSNGTKGKVVHLLN
jgi:predicted nucleic-acid-binding Zn-ribbon protein